MNFFEKIKDSLKKTKDNIVGKIDGVLKSFTKIDEELFQELEETLILGDVSAETSIKICEALRKKIKETGSTDPSEIKSLLKSIIEENLSSDNQIKLETKPSIILIVGVNGVGKTTTIGKLAYKLKSKGKKVILSAADTFRAAAIEQLDIWAQKSECDIVKQQNGSDPAAVVFDSISAAKARDTDVIICDTAGRLHNKKNLMAELGKISRIIQKELPNADKETLLVLDASTGQNAINQAIEFKNVCDISGIILTKLDGTAKGGVILSVKDKLGIPIKFVGIGEGIEDLREFNPKEFADALFE